MIKNFEDRKYCDMPMLHQIGVILHCYNCNKNSYIDFNCCDKPKICKNEKNIFCLSCENIIPNTSKNDNMIFKGYDWVVKKKSEYMFNKFYDYKLYSEMNDISLEEKMFILEIIDIFIINQLKFSDFKIKLISFEYMLLRILNMFGININEKLCYSKELIDFFENSFQQLIGYSIYDLNNRIEKYKNDQICINKYCNSLLMKYFDI